MTNKTNGLMQHADKLEKFADKMATPAPTDWKGALKIIGQTMYAIAVLVASLYTMTWAGMTGSEYELLTKIGMGLVSLNLIIMPKVVSDWALEGLHRIAAFIFTIVEIALLFSLVSAIVNFNRGNTLGWVAFYLDNIAPIQFGYVIIVWSTLLMLDPEARQKFRNKKKAQEIQLKKESIEAVTNILVELAHATAHSEQVLSSAGIDLDEIENYIPEIKTEIPETEKVHQNGASKKEVSR